MDVGAWLKSLGLEQYEAVFHANDVDAEVLPTLTGEELKDIGVSSIRHRRRLLEAAAELHSNTTSPLPVQEIETRRPSLSATERRQITVLFCDIVGSTPLSTRLDPEELRDVLSAYQATVAAAVAGKKGYIARFVGDGVLAYFGWPNPDEAHAQSSVRAALAVIEALRSQQLSVRIGIATGLVVTGDLVGVGAAQTVTAVGETPNLAARLQALAQPDTVVVSKVTRSQLGSMFELEQLGAFTLKGFNKPVSAWRVQRDTGAASRSEIVYETRLTPLVGRNEELDLLLRRWQEAKTGEGRVVLLSGEAGIGKSRLLAELEGRLTGEQHVNLRYFCSPHHQDSPLYPVIARWEQEAGFARGDTAEDRLTKLEALLASSTPALEHLALFATLMSIPTDERYPPLELSAQQWKVQIFAALIQRLVNLTRQAPVLILFEDAHWADPTSIELLDAVIEQVPDLPVLLMVSFRPEFAATWFGRSGVSLMNLNRLDRRNAMALAAQVIKDNVLASPLLDRIVAQSDGVPLFIEELSKAVLEAPDLDQTNAALAVPTTLQASLIARLDRLPAAKQVAQIGAVIGRKFAYSLLAAVAGLPEIQLSKGIDELVTAGLAFRRGLPPDAAYTFKHALVQEVAYESLLKAQRQHFHRRIAEVIRDQIPDWAHKEPELVAYHFTQGGLAAAAIEWWGKAGELAMRRSAFAEAITHLEAALRLAEGLADGPEQRRSRLRLQVTYGNALRIAQGFGVPETQAAFVAARNLAIMVDDISERFPAYYGLWSGSFLRGDLTSMQETAAAFLRDVESRPGSPEAAMAYRICGMTHWFGGGFGEARRNLEQALGVYRAVRDFEAMSRFGQDVVTPAMTYLALVLWPLGLLERASSLVEEAISYALKTKNVSIITYGYGHAATFETLRRDRLRAALYVEALLGPAHKYGIAVWIAFGTFIEGWVRSGAEEREAGIAEMHEGLVLMRSQYLGTFMPLMATLLAEAEAENGRPDVALAALDEELATIERTGQRWFHSELHRTRGEMLLKCQPYDMAAAEAAFMRAIDIARSQAVKLFELQAAVSLGRLWMGEGKLAAAHELIAPIAAWFDDDLDCNTLRVARNLLNSTCL